MRTQPGWRLFRNPWRDVLSRAGDRNRNSSEGQRLGNTVGAGSAGLDGILAGGAETEHRAASGLLSRIWPPMR